MVLDFSDQPYQFFPPKPNALVTAIAMQLNRRFVLPGAKHRIRQIQLRGSEKVLPLIARRQRCLLLPNHPTHSDPQLMFEVQRRLRMSASTMAAYDVFLRNRPTAWLMQRIGCFSVDREGSDSLAMKTAVEVLARGDRALTVFPEGNVLLMNDRVTPFLGGAAFIGMRAQKRMGADEPIHAIPISIKLSHLTNCADQLERQVDGLERSLGIERAATLDLRHRIRAVGVQILSRNLRQRGYLPAPSEHEDLGELLTSSALKIITHLEKKMEITVDLQDLPLERVRRVRTKIHQVRIDPDQQLDHRVAATWADEAILATRILSYSTNYISESPTLDRHAETIEKLREDLNGRIIPPSGDRVAYIQFGTPIDLRAWLSKKGSAALNELTRQFEQAVQEGINSINESCDLPGSRML